MGIQKFKSIRFIGILMVFFLTCIEESQAFFSPSSLQLLASSIGPWVQYLLVITITAIISLSIKIKNKKRILTLSLIFFILLLFIILGRFYIIKSLNQHQVGINDLQKLSYDNLKAHKPQTIEFNQTFLDSHFVDLNSISLEEYHGFRAIMLEHNPDKEYKLMGAKYIPSTRLWSLLKENISTINNFLNSVNISLNDKLLFVCHHGTMSSIIAYLFSNRGFDSYYSSLVSMDNPALIKGSLIKDANIQNSIITKPFHLQKNDNFIIFIFGTDEAHYLCSKDGFSLISPEADDFDKISEKMKLISASEFGKTSFLEECEIPFSNIEDMDIYNSKILCFNPLHCLLTQHHLDYLNLTTQVKEIFRIGEIEGTDFNQLKRGDSG